MASNNIKYASLHYDKQYRIIPSKYPPISFFEEMVEPSQMDALFELESLTNDRLKNETGDIRLVANEDKISGPGSSIIMAAFTHINKPSRFTDGTYGIYYCANTLEAAVRETVFHRERFLRYTDEERGEYVQRVYVGTILKPMHDLRAEKFNYLHDPDITTYGITQAFAKKLRLQNSWGLVYRSVRSKDGGECIAAFRPPAISIPTQERHIIYFWDGTKIAEVSDINGNKIESFATVVMPEVC